LVCVFLRGGADGLSLIVPHGDPLYYRERPGTAIPRADVIDLDGYFGLHPALAPLWPWWRRGELAVVQGAGLADGTGSHGDAQDRIERLLASPRWAPGEPRPGTAGATPPGGRTSYPSGHSLAAIARLLRAGVRLPWARVDMGGWDTHVHQGGGAGRLATRLAHLGRSLAAFATDLGEALRDVVVVTVTEFGRSVRENGVGGTDHGRATTMLALGGAVHGGRVHGAWPGLERANRAEGDGLAVTTDVAAVLAALRGDDARLPGLLLA
jgi:uncharacterized protein (DUF1501 family)